jgi:hypothetical protein
VTVAQAFWSLERKRARRTRRSQRFSGARFGTWPIERHVFLVLSFSGFCDLLRNRETLATEHPKNDARSAEELIERQKKTLRTPRTSRTLLFQLSDGGRYVAGSR